MGVWALGLLLLGGRAHPPAAVADPQPRFEAQARELAGLRAELERIGADLLTERELQRGRARSAAARIGDLQLRTEQERSRLGALKEAQQQAEQQAQQEMQRLAELRPGAERVLAGLLSWVESSLPFRRSERAEELSQVRARLAAGRLDPVAAVGRAWHFLEDELTLASSCGLSRQVIDVGGQQQLVTVARLGLALLYYRAPDGAVGHAVPSATGYRFEPLADSADRQAVERLFDSFGRGVTTGTFELPVAGLDRVRP